MTKGTLVVAVLLCLSGSISAARIRRQSGRCRYRGVYYLPGQQLTFHIQRKRFDCTCMNGGRLDCTWTHMTPPENSKCRDRATGQLKDIGEQWERTRNGRVFDCVCNRGRTAMEVSCTDENRCHHDARSYRRGDQFTTTSLSGRAMDCTCLAQKELKCQFSEDVPGTEQDVHQMIVNYEVYGGKLLRPQITTIQACRTGAKVVSSGDTWNQTKTNAFGVRVIEQCACVNAIVKCKTQRILDRIEPHCVSVDGNYRAVGQKWIRVPASFPNQQHECVCRSHEDIFCRRAHRPRCVDDVAGTIRIAGDVWERVHPALPNLKFECSCNETKEITCRDIGECNEPSAPTNGALFCAKIGRDGPGQITYCKPMCLASYEFINPQRYFRIWEVCGPVNLHRWSGGFVDDPSAIAKCTAREGSRRRGHANLYLPTDNCQTLTNEQIEDLKTLFLRQLAYRSLCLNKCEITVFKCGIRN